MQPLYIKIILFKLNLIYTCNIRYRKYLLELLILRLVHYIDRFCIHTVGKHEYWHDLELLLVPTLSYSILLTNLMSDTGFVP